MRRVVMLNRVSIDGYFATNNEATFGMDWFVHDPEVDAYVHNIGPQKGGADTLLLGEITYIGFKNSWQPTLNDPSAPAPMRKIAQELAEMKKIVFSKTIKSSDWQNTEFHAGDLPQVVKKLKQQDGGTIMIMGSGTIVQQLANAGLVDDYVFIVTPVIAGQGKQLFKDVKQTWLKIQSIKRFDSGNVVMHYSVDK